MQGAEHFHFLSGQPDSTMENLLTSPLGVTVAITALSASSTNKGVRGATGGCQPAATTPPCVRRMISRHPRLENPCHRLPPSCPVCLARHIYTFIVGAEKYANILLEWGIDFVFPAPKVSLSTRPGYGTRGVPPFSSFAVVGESI